MDALDARKAKRAISLLVYQHNWEPLELIEQELMTLRSIAEVLPQAESYSLEGLALTMSACGMKKLVEAA